MNKFGRPTAVFKALRAILVARFGRPSAVFKALRALSNIQVAGVRPDRPVKLVSTVICPRPLPGVTLSF